MNFIEESLHNTAGRRFKLFLKKQTSNNFKAVTGGTLITGILQSSSVVNVMVLAFVSTGLLTMQRALAIVLGDNLGTTVDSWFYATAGFGLNIGYIAYVITGIAGIAMLLFKKKKQFYQWSTFILGIGFLFLGLDFMKSSMLELVKQINLADFRQHGSVFFLLAGLVITGLIQSSSATMAILLSALYVNAIDLYSATAMVLGAEIGTTLKFLLASVNGAASKKRVALGNFLFNVISSAIALIFLRPINNFIVSITGEKHILIALPFFQTLINLMGIILFFPLLRYFALLLEKFFTKSREESLFIHKVDPENTDLAIDAFEKEAGYLIQYVTDYILEVFKIKVTGEGQSILSEQYKSGTLQSKYEFIKNLHGELHTYYIKLHTHPNSQHEAIVMEKLISSVRNCIYAAKSIKDAELDADMLRNSSNDSKYQFYQKASEKTADFCNRVSQLLQKQPGQIDSDELVGLFKDVQEGYTNTLKTLYKQESFKNLNENEISSLVNFNRQLYTAYKSVILAVKEYLLDEKQAEFFDSLPGFIH